MKVKGKNVGVFQDSSTFTDVDPLSDAECLPAECRGLRAVLHPGVPRTSFFHVKFDSRSV